VVDQNYDNRTKVLLLADQPFQLKVMSYLAERLMTFDIEVDIALTDLFTFVYGPDLIEEATKILGKDLISLKEEFVSWQERGNPDPDRLKEAKLKLQKFSELSSAGRSMETIRRCDPYTNGFEFESWYLYISPEWKDVAHADILKKCEYISSEICPNLIISIDNCQLLTNFLHAMTASTIPFITFQNTRINSRWVPRSDFAIGSHKNSSNYCQNKQTKSNHIESINTFIEDFKRQSSGLYIAPSIILGNNFSEFSNLKTGKKLITLAPEVYDIFKGTIRSVITGPRTRSFKVRRFDQNFLKINLAEARRRVLQFRKDSNLTTNDFSESGYFFWALHYRPEGSGLVLGNGVDEFEILEDLVQVLSQHNQKLVIKENPLMYGTRKASTLKQLTDFPNVYLAPRGSASIDWIRNSKGVIGISGTCLLEATILGVPSYCFGQPEFKECVWSTEEISIASFIERCIHLNIPSKQESLLDYLDFVWSNSTEEDLMLNALTSTEQLVWKQNLERMLAIIKQKLIKL